MQLPTEGELSDIQDIIRNIEEDFRSDLTTHLYSAYLMKLNNKFEHPKKEYTSWPLPFQFIPDPKSTSIYIDENNPFKMQRIASRATGTENNNEDDDVWIDRKRPKFDRRFRRFMTIKYLSQFGNPEQVRRYTKILANLRELNNRVPENLESNKMKYANGQRILPDDRSENIENMVQFYDNSTSKLSDTEPVGFSNSGDMENQQDVSDEEDEEGDNEEEDDEEEDDEAFDYSDISSEGEKEGTECGLEFEDGSSPHANLKIELNGLFQRLIYSKISSHSEKLQNQGELSKPLEALVEPPPNLSEPHMKTLFHRLDVLLQHILLQRKQLWPKGSERFFGRRTKPMNWADILTFSCLANDDGNIAYRKMYRRNHELFVQAPRNYIHPKHQAFTENHYAFKDCGTPNEERLHKRRKFEDTRASLARGLLEHSNLRPPCFMARIQRRMKSCRLMIDPIILKDSNIKKTFQHIRPRKNNGIAKKNKPLEASRIHNGISNAKDRNVKAHDYSRDIETEEKLQGKVEERVEVGDDERDYNTAQVVIKKEEDKKAVI
ncbi:hypothetical protein DASC09_000080 [Saccharomycopsis crataegensis]|uniref:Rrn9 domain-containing protein n=1 Tax=Saccharomycopsis crataegensis TaxID=43959 RepID=A0AAV5QER3_9ASCO|nr:hypothetical protein DASC09_000080 [Saccharomycopsis crataegensis]